MAWTPKVTKSVVDGEVQSLAVGHPLVDEYLAFLGARVRLNSWLAAAYDLKVFFCVVVKEPADVRKVDIFSFIADQRRPRHGPKVVRLEDGESGLAARTIKRRLATLSGFFTYLVAREDVDMVANPVPSGSAGRRSAGQPGKGNRALIRTPRTLPRVVGPTDVSSFLDALRTHRDRAMVNAMLLGGLRRCEVLGLRLADLNAGERRLFVAEGKAGNQRVVPISARFFQAVGDYLLEERPLDASTQRVFVALKGPRRGRPLSPSGLDEVIGSARARAGIDRLTCHQLRHTCMTRLREAGMALEAVQAQAGHRSIESTRIYLHLGDRWVAEEYARARAAIDHDLAQPER